MDAALPSILPLGDPRLRARAEPVTNTSDATFRAEAKILARALAELRKANGFGRAIAAPQIGVGKRFVAIDLEGAPKLLVNPEITWRSDALFTMWDDCLSFPNLLVRVRRHESISLRYVDERGQARTWNELDRAASELVQHEIDHLDGVLAIDRAFGDEPFVTRAMFEAVPARYLERVDYAIGAPSIRPPAQSTHD